MSSERIKQFTDAINTCANNDNDRRLIFSFYVDNMTASFMNFFPENDGNLVHVFTIMHAYLKRNPDILQAFIEFNSMAEILLKSLKETEVNHEA
jgi:hypothetical protein